MKHSRILLSWLRMSLIVGAMSIVSLLPFAAAAQTGQSPASSSQSQDTQSLQQQIDQLRQQVADLQKALQRQSSRKPSMDSGMGKKKQQAGMAMEDKNRSQSMSAMESMPMDNLPANVMGQSMGDTGEMGSVSMGEMEQMGEMPVDSMGQHKNPNEMPGMSGMGNMGRMKGSPRMAAQSAMPGFPGESHLYHIGATGFFLDHPQHITLTQGQQNRLNQIREKALLSDATAQRRIDQAEQDLYTLTGADQPDEAKIQAKVKEIANLGVEKRLAYIRAVGEAAQVLSDEQRRELLGQVQMEMKK